LILVTGANGVVGAPLCQKLADEGRPFLSVSRQTQTASESLLWDMELTPNESQRMTLSTVTSVIHCAPIWLLAAQIESFKGCRLQRIVVFSSTSVLSKKVSSDVREQSLVQQLSDSEDKIMQLSQEQGWQLTILRPSMIYGYQRDQNVTHIARFIRRYGIMFVVGAASGKRQPVQADDLVSATYFYWPRQSAESDKDTSRAISYCAALR